MIAMAASLAPPTPQADTTPVGVLGTSMVEMLDGENATGVVELDELRELVLRDFEDDDAEGSGIDVAVIDTGVAPVPGLDGADKVLHGPDLSIEGSAQEVAFLDTYGHGTHMAGIIAGDRNGARGIAPGARIISLKVAGADGITTVPQVVAAIDWVVEHHNTDGLNIRVLNLSLGQAGVTDHVGDALSAAVERAWNEGIFVVVAAGNRGEDQDHLDSPAIDPYVMAVGAADSLSAVDRKHLLVPAWSAVGDGDRNPDLTGPGRSIASYRVPGSTIDIAAPSARYGDDLFRGSGTSQAAAVVSGTAAVVLSEHPSMTNDDLKLTLTESAKGLNDNPEIVAGDGLVDSKHAVDKPKDAGPQGFSTAAGAGTGLAAPTGNSWSGGSWSGNSWSGNSWSGMAWSGGSWSGNSWSGNSWSGNSWSGNSWSGNSWSGGSWSGNSWSGNSWSGNSWSGTGWD